MLWEVHDECHVLGRDAHFRPHPYLFDDCVALPGEIFMTTTGWLQVAFYMAAVILLAKPLGAFMSRVYQFQPLFGLDRFLGPVERLTYKLSGVKRDDEQDWKQYALSCLAFNLLGVLVVYVLQRVQ